MSEIANPDPKKQANEILFKTSIINDSRFSWLHGKTGSESQIARALIYNRIDFLFGSREYLNGKNKVGQNWLNFWLLTEISFD